MNTKQIKVKLLFQGPGVNDGCEDSSGPGIGLVRAIQNKMTAPEGSCRDSVLKVKSESPQAN